MMIARFPYGGSDATQICDWLAGTVLWAERNPKIERPMLHGHVNDTPTPMARNRAVLAAIEHDVDLLVMIDNDMAPDIDKAHPFIPEAFKFVTKRWHQAPTIIAAPYLSAAPKKVPCIGMWRTTQDGRHVEADMYTREEALMLHGIQPAPLLGTGLMLLDMRIFTGFEAPDGDVVKLPPPWFEYEYDEPYHANKLTTEDIYMTRNVSLLFGNKGIVTNFCAWDHWADHLKVEPTGRPVSVTSTDLARLLRAAQTPLMGEEQ